MLVGFCAVEVGVVEPGKDQLHEVGELVELSVKLIQVPAQKFVIPDEKEATGAKAFCVEV